MDLFLPVFNADPVNLAIMVIFGSLALFAMSYVAWHDYKTYNIDCLILFIAALAVLPVIMATEGISVLPGTLVTAVIFGGVTWLGQQLRPGKMGTGDIPLMGFIGLVAGPDNAILVLVAFVVFSALTSATYSIRRGKKLFKSMFSDGIAGHAGCGICPGIASCMAS